MKFKLTKQHSGFTLLELLLVLAVVAVVLFLGIGRYQQHKKMADIAVVEQNVNILFDALNTYYYQYCRQDRDFSSMTNMQQLQQANLLPYLVKTNLVVPGSDGYDYQVQATLIGKTMTSGKPIYQLSITAQLNIPNDVQTVTTYQQLLNAKSVAGTRLTWVRLPTYTISSVASNLWIMNNSLHFFKENETTTDKTCGY